MRRSSRAPRTTAAVAALLIATALVPGAIASAQEGPFPDELVLTPESDAAVAGTCNEFTARVTGFSEGVGGGPPVEGVTVDVLQTLSSAGTEPSETRELAFCNPVNEVGANPTGQGGTAFGDVSGNNPGQTAGDPGRNTVVHGEAGPTNANGEVTFGITMTPGTTAGSVAVTAWVDVFGDDDTTNEADPSDSSTKTWNAAEPSVTALDAAPESATNQNGTQHAVTVTMSADGSPVGGVVPQSVIEADASGRPPGDVADPNAGQSPNVAPGNANVYACTPSNAQGVSTCTFQDPGGTGPGTDTIVFFVDLGGATGQPDQGDPQDAVQKTWFVAGGGSTPPPVTPEPRNIRLCQGSSPAPVCDTSTEFLEAGDTHELSVLVTDEDGDSLGGVPVELRHSGPARFEANDGHVLTVTTAADGTAVVSLHSDVEGTSTIVAEISPPGTTGSIRGPGSADDECEQPAGPNGAPPAGNCVSASLAVVWFLNGHDVPECDDGVDNDGDDLVDLEDPGCEDANDDSETPDPNPEIPIVKHERRTNMRFRDWVGPGDEGLVIFGRVRLVDDDDGFRKCTQAQPVLIQRRVDGVWETKKNATTNARGRWAGVVFDRTGPHRAVAPRTEIQTATAIHVCQRALIVKTHHHRR